MPPSPSASVSQRNLSEVDMVNEDMDKVIHDVGEGDNSKDHQHAEQSNIIYLGASGSKNSSNPGSNIGARHAPDLTRSKSMPYQSEQNQSAPPEGGNRGQEQGDSSVWSNHYQNVGGDDGNQDQPSRVPTGGGADDDRTENADPTDRQTEAWDMAIVIALGLINEVNNIMLVQVATRSSS
jgi:hypothetical protein